MNKFIIIFGLGIFIFQSVFTQTDILSKTDSFPFIRYKKNNYSIYDTNEYDILFSKFIKINNGGEENINIVHIGDSHIQADFFSGYFRKRLQRFFNSVGGRGFIFPYKIAHTNNPLDYIVNSTGKWTNCKNISKKRCELGLSGMSISTIDASSSVSIILKEDSVLYDFNSVVVFHKFGDRYFKPKIINEHLIKVIPNIDKGCTVFEFDTVINTIKLKFSKTDEEQDRFTLFGFSFYSRNHGIIYHTVGVNGAKVESYLKCNYFGEQLRYLNADWVIVSLGTNDSYTSNFDTVKFSKNLNDMILKIKQSSPNAAVLFVTPGDDYINKTIENNNVKLASEIIKKITKEQGVSYWDFYNIMGGDESIVKWYNYGLAHTDYLHFTIKGYEIQSELMFNAFLKLYYSYLEVRLPEKKWKIEPLKY